MPQFWILLLILVIVAPLLGRAYALRPGAVRRWRRNPPKPLSDSEITRLRRWQTRNILLFVFFAVIGIADAILTGLRVLNGSLAIIVWFVFILLGITSMGHHFHTRCPNCGMLIGVQGNLLLPKKCQRCRVGFINHR